MRRLILLGTGTGVGKTYVGVALAQSLRAAGAVAVSALKPVETGTLLDSSGAPAPDSDAASLERAMFHVEPPRPHPLYALVDPVSPHLAARQAGVEIDLRQICAWAEADAQALPSQGAVQIIETAGGVLSPLSPALVNLDLARALEPALFLLVAPDALGVLHDVRATLLAMESLARAPDFLVLSAAREPDASTGTNAEELARLGLLSPIAVLSRAQGADLSALARAILTL